MCDIEGRHPNTVKMIKILKWIYYDNILEVRIFIGVCVYFRIYDQRLCDRYCYHLQIIQKEYSIQIKGRREEDHISTIISSGDGIRVSHY